MGDGTVSHTNIFIRSIEAANGRVIDVGTGYGKTRERVRGLLKTKKFQYFSISNNRRGDEPAG